MAAAITCAAISTSSSAIRMSTLGFLQSRAAAIRCRPRGFVSSSLGVVEVEYKLNDSWRKCGRSSSLGVACDDRRRRRRREEGLWRRLRATGEGKSEVEDGDGLSSSVKDMERYLDELSIEYDSVWDTKPACGRRCKNYVQSNGFRVETWIMNPFSKESWPIFQSSGESDAQTHQDQLNGIFFVKIHMWSSSKNSRGDGAFCLWDFDGSQFCMYCGIGENCFNRCQPWTIALTGVIGISASWLLLHSIVLTAVVSVLVSAWWFLFLYSYPLAYAQMIAQRRKDQKDGLEDTFGTRQRSN